MATASPPNSTSEKSSVWCRLFKKSNTDHENSGPLLWSLGVLNPSDTIEVPGSVLLLARDHNTPLGLRQVHPRNSHSSLPTGIPIEHPSNPGTPRDSRPASPARAPSFAQPSVPGNDSSSVAPTKDPKEKRTPDGKIILNPQPEESANDPLNWPSWRRDLALLSLGFYCMIGGGITPLLAAGFTDISKDYDVPVERVSLTTGLYMMGMGIGSVIASPTAILYGKRPVYLASAIIFILTCVWAALSLNFTSLIFARIFQGIVISPVECLPSATIAEIFFLHERAFRIGIYTLLLLGGKNLIPLVSAAIIQSLGWPWVFWIVAMTVGLGFVLLFFFTPESFWDRTPVPKKWEPSRPSLMKRLSSHIHMPGHYQRTEDPDVGIISAPSENPTSAPQSLSTNVPENLHVSFAPIEEVRTDEDVSASYFRPAPPKASSTPPPVANNSLAPLPTERPEYIRTPSYDVESLSNLLNTYTNALRQQPALTFAQQLKPYNGRLSKDVWWKVMLRPFILFCYPSVTWSSFVYACSIGWLVVISESLAMIYRSKDYYNFDALQTGLVYLSPFIGGVLGTAVAGKVSDVIVKAMARHNGGLYEPEFRLVMTIPIIVTTVMGLMAFGWAVEERDNFMVPTIFFGVVSFGCSLGSTTSITFTVDSYRQYAGEALVTLNFSKNISHGLVFSLFVTHWLTAQGPKMVFIWIGIIQLVVMVTSIPMYIFGKRARLWTVRANLMEKL